MCAFSYVCIKRSFKLYFSFVYCPLYEAKAVSSKFLASTCPLQIYCVIVFIIVMMIMMVMVMIIFFFFPEGRPGMADVSPLSGISGLSFDSTLISPFLFFHLLLLLFLSCLYFLPTGPFY